MTKTLSEIKAEAGRDLDSSLADSTLVPGESSNFGAFSFGALWNWIKGKCATVVQSGNANPVTSGAVKAELDASYYNKQSVDGNINNALAKTQSWWNIFINQQITETSITVKTSYNNRKLSDYPLLIFTIGASLADRRNTIVIPNGLFSANGQIVMLRAYSGDSFVELSIGWRSDTEITVSKSGNAGFTPYLNILGYGTHL